MELTWDKAEEHEPRSANCPRILGLTQGWSACLPGRLAVHRQSRGWGQLCESAVHRPGERGGAGRPWEPAAEEQLVVRGTRSPRRPLGGPGRAPPASQQCRAEGDAGPVRGAWSHGTSSCRNPSSRPGRGFRRAPAARAGGDTPARVPSPPMPGLEALLAEGGPGSPAPWGELADNRSFWGHWHPSTLQKAPTQTMGPRRGSVNGPLVGIQK